MTLFNKIDSLFLLAVTYAVKGEGEHERLELDFGRDRRRNTADLVVVAASVVVCWKQWVRAARRKRGGMAVAVPDFAGAQHPLVAAGCITPAHNGDGRFLLEAAITIVFISFSPVPFWHDTALQS